MKRYSILFLLLVIVTSSMFFGCKKGQDDPFFSFRSRKARIDGTYNVTSQALSYTSVDTAGRKFQTDFLITGSTLKETVKVLGLTSALGGDSLIINGYAKPINARGTIIQDVVTFDKKGPYNAILEYKIVAVIIDEVAQTETTITKTYREENRGSWDFLSGVDNYKKKERITLVLEDSRVTTTEITAIKNIETLITVTLEPIRRDVVLKYANGENSQVLHIRELRSKKMVFEQDINNYRIENNATVYSQEGTMIETLEEVKN